MNGKLYLVATPIGNLEDITLRSLFLLKTCDIILAEDTRKAGILLKHYDISKKLYAHHSFNEHQATPEIIRWLLMGSKICLITDAGTPGISDPGYLLIRECISQGIPIESPPGASALLPALLNSGLPCDRFCFEGFLPVKKGRMTRLNSLAEEERTMIFYESPHRILKTLEEFISHFGSERKSSISKELTKIYEETVRGSLLELKQHFTKNIPKGEFTLCVAGLDPKMKSLSSLNSEKEEKVTGLNLEGEAMETE
jgi:16S rRNA (cytidine1402-2'-O)-methyltransferase